MTIMDSDAGPRSKRAAILAAAVGCFGEFGYEATKWSTVADRVGIGQTALYHYFESKAHCLLTIMHAELHRSHERFLEATAGVDPADGLRAALAGAFDVTEREVLQMRILQNHIDLLEIPRASAREEESRQAARALVHDIEMAWTGLLDRGMAAGAFPARDPHTLAQAVLGLLVSVWRWYRWGGRLDLAAVRDFYAGCALRMVLS
ncbi:TetR/AcrR family transcriptional regulator [Phytohabitans rumicis]|uniref:TetR family transcriptional regulator n=1 Tax=Phytohabitans rumicis TaxID=1076125 RepID=A0A6V8KVN1_9ACTN|nr:TetR/AcrR family transcriptional regulator [Phytohabitans rumicis]GFJ86461.1 TetR family transcriptional regulator [Phytohabitans rumicis]